MLLFHAILFFLFGTCAVAVPILGKISDALGFSTPVEKQASGVWSFRRDGCTYVALLQPETANFILVYSSTGMKHSPQYQLDWVWERVKSVAEYEAIVSMAPHHVEGEKMDPETVRFLKRHPVNLNIHDQFRVIPTQGKHGQNILAMEYMPDASKRGNWKTVGYVKEDK